MIMPNKIHPPKANVWPFFLFLCFLVATRDYVFDSFHQNSSRNWFEEYSLEHGTFPNLGIL